MGSCINDLYGYEVVKNCNVCGIVLLKIDFHENKKMSDGSYKECKSCRKHCYNENLTKTKKYFVDNRGWITEYFLDNRSRIKWIFADDGDRLNEYHLKNHDKTIVGKKIYSNIRYKTALIFRLIKNTRSRSYHALKGRSKSFSNKGILDKEIDTYRERIEFQITAEMSWLNIAIDHVKSFSNFKTTNDGK